MKRKDTFVTIFLVIMVITCLLFLASLTLNSQILFKIAIISGGIMAPLLIATTLSND